MSCDSEQARKYESEFLSGAELNLLAARGTRLRGAYWEKSQHDDHERLRSEMLAGKNYDRARLARLPQNRRLVLHGYEPRSWFLPAALANWKPLRRRATVAVASTLSPLDAVAREGSRGGSLPPIDATTLLEHVRGLVLDPKVHHVVGVCCPTGLTDDARRAISPPPNVSLVLVEPNGRGGWRTTAVGDAADARWTDLFDPESTQQKVDRVRDEVARRSGELLTGGVSAETIAERLTIPINVVTQALRVVADEDPELRISSEAGRIILYRSGPLAAREPAKMSMLDRIRQLFDREGDEARKIQMFSEQRARLSERRDRMYAAIGQLEERERELTDEGIRNTSKVVRRRLAAQIAQLRKDIERQNTSANMLNQQINIISTRIHNLTLLQQGQMVAMPTTEELTEEAVQAEELLERIRGDAEMVGTLETGMSEAMTSRDELEILREFEAADAEKQKQAAAPPAQQATDEEPTAWRLPEDGPDRKREAEGA